MTGGFPGLGTLLNAATVIVGSLIGMLVGNRLPERTRDLVTDCLGLVTLLMAALSAASVMDGELTSRVRTGAPVLIVLGSLLIGGIAGSMLRIEDRLESLGDAAARWSARRRGRALEGAAEQAEADRFTQGWLTATLLFCVGPLTILGSLDDGLGRGIDKLAVKSVLDGFASMAFAASFGIGVLASALSVLVIQGALTIVGIFLGTIMPAAQIAALTATGGLVLAGIGLRLLRIRQIPVGDMLPALVVAPLLTTLVAR
ncbi:MAG: DUF554 domain-containing protein [Austwickia sp.]|jgi:uncharacterized membrane protein YqgA involved in biofilm formation|nr:MAG: DUF554 domain-containing protein [Austwickia sp.]